MAGVAENLFDRVKPHKYLQAEIRRDLWAAVQRVRRQPEAFAAARAWLHATYAEATLREKCQRAYRHHHARRLCLHRSPPHCDRTHTYWRRLFMQGDVAAFARAMRLPISRDVVEKLVRSRKKRYAAMVEMTLDEVQFRGGQISHEDGRYIIRSNKHPRDIPVTKATVEVVWRCSDEQYRQRYRELKAERRERVMFDKDDPGDRAWRLRQACDEIVAAGFIAGEGVEENAARVILLAAILSDPEKLPLPGEFCQWEWNASDASSDDTIRNWALFDPFYREPAPFGADGLAWDTLAFSRFVQLLADALALMPTNAGPVSEPLTRLEMEILTAMKQLGAVSSDTRQTRAEIGYKTTGSDGNSVAKPLRALVDKKMVGSNTGRGGGYWLTAAALVRLSRIKT